MKTYGRIRPTTSNGFVYAISHLLRPDWHIRRLVSNEIVDDTNMLAAKLTAFGDDFNPAALTVEQVSFQQERIHE